MARKEPKQAEAEETPRPMGRPSDYSVEIAEELCARMAEGETVNDIIASDDKFPNRSTIWRWRQANADFRILFTCAREAQMETWADQIISISDDGTRDYKIDENENGSARPIVDHDHIARARLRVDTRKFLMAKIAPKMFGDKLALTGADGGPIETKEVGDGRVAARRTAFLLRAAKARREGGTASNSGAGDGSS